MDVYYFEKVESLQNRVADLLEEKGISIDQLIRKMILMSEKVVTKIRVENIIKMLYRLRGNETLTPPSYRKKSLMVYRKILRIAINLL